MGGGVTASQILNFSSRGRWFILKAPFLRDKDAGCPMGRGLVWPRTGIDIAMAKINIPVPTANRFLVLRPIASGPVELYRLTKTTRNNGVSDVDNDENDDNNNNIIQDGRSRVRVPMSLNFFQFA
jgi:hypothetical protein